MLAMRCTVPILRPSASELKNKEAAGKAVGNKELESRGKGEQAEGKIQTGYGDVKEDLSDLKKDIKKSV